MGSNELETGYNPFFGSHNKNGFITRLCYSKVTSSKTELNLGSLNPDILYQICAMPRVLQRLQEAHKHQIFYSITVKLHV